MSDFVQLCTFLRDKHCHCRWTAVDQRDVCISCCAATAIETLQSELERERQRADEAERENKNLAPTGRFNGLDIYAWQDKAVAVQSRLDAIEAMAAYQRDDYYDSDREQHEAGAELRALILDGKDGK